MSKNKTEPKHGCAWIIFAFFAGIALIMLAYKI